MQPSLQQPAPVQVTWPREQRRSNLTDIYTPTLFRSSWRLLAALDTTPKRSSTTSRKTQTTIPLAMRGWKGSRMCSCYLAPLSGIIHTIRATHSQHHTLPNSHKMVRSPHLCSHLLTHRRPMVLLLQVSCPAHCYHAVQSAHKSLRVPLVMSQAMKCRSLRRSRNSHSWSSYSAAASRLLLPSRLSYQSPLHSWTLLCRRLHLVTPLRMCPRRRLISRSPRYLLTWQCRRLPTGSTPYLWTLPCRRSHTTQMGSRPASSFSIDVFVQTPIRSTVLHDTSTQLPITEFFIGCIFSNDPFDRQRSSSAQGDIGSASLPPLPDIATTCTLSSSSLDSDDLFRTLAPRALLQPPPGLEQFAPPPGLAIDAHLCTPHGIPVTAAPLRPQLRSAISVTPPQPPACTIHVGTHYARSATAGKRSASTALAGTLQSC